ncbi:glycoside hydrolase family 5 protein [Crepidotus variabilis]|uniref:Glycoside hydrolase family 5 protein n=1 Tax=Crepidotus variabilis TaxID=179855 RepID=A0A9P6EH92_9AGAR|nr:glycoside hydrolase family 5 protein [Crepidotus variabilis]
MPSTLLKSLLAVASCVLFQLSFATPAPTDASASNNGGAGVPGLPAKIYGVNLGSWLLIEPWMLPAEWVAMGGEQCDDCSACIRSEFALAQAYPDTVDATLKKHWQTWFSQSDVNAIKAAGINTVRIPLGYWIIEPLVNRKTEFYARGGIVELVRGLSQLKAAGIKVILDHHALPGVASPNQMFAGKCTTDVQFYTDYNYHRALVWTAVMTALSHLHPEFSSVVSIQAINEPIMDATQTPSLGNFYKNFVQTIRAVELSLGIPIQGSGFDVPNLKINSDSGSLFNADTIASLNATGALSKGATSLREIFTPEVISVLEETVPTLLQVATQLKMNLAVGALGSYWERRQPLIANMMDVNWQYNSPSNPADAAIGPQAYDNHLYYSFGGVADPNEEAYLTHLCNLNRIETDAAVGNSPLWFGEWSLATQFNATDEFLFKWADAQKLQYSKGAGWLFWNWKIEISGLAGDTARQWSYQEALRRGYFSQNPTELHDPNVCVPYIKSPTVVQ